MVLLRHAPGERVPISGTYALVDHFGEALGFVGRFEKGDRLPLATATESGPSWYFLADVSGEAAKAA